MLNKFNLYFFYVFYFFLISKNIYADIVKKIDVKGMAHITGGGLTENIPRILKDGLMAKIDLGTWKFPKIFQWLQDSGKISQMDMLKIFNCGVGMVCVIDSKDVIKSQKILKKNGFKSFFIGSINKSQSNSTIEYI